MQSHPCCRRVLINPMIVYLLIIGVGMFIIGVLTMISKDIDIIVSFCILMIGAISLFGTVVLFNQQIAHEAQSYAEPEFIIHISPLATV